jgi:NOL1/NOP2/fmu family ribosome biogenesis protein
MLTPGGKLVYSTCTFAPDENEGSMARFLERHPEFSIGKVKKAEGMAAGVPGWADIHTVSFGEETFCEPVTEKTEQNVALADTIRLWPHRLHGEGHYMAVLQKEGVAHSAFASTAGEQGIPPRDLKTPGRGCPEFFAFAQEELKKIPEGSFLKFGDQLYLMPKGMPALKGLKVLRPGLHLGTIKKNRFEPSHALALALKPDEAVHTVDFVSGEMVSCAGEDGVSEKSCFKPGNEIAAYLNGQSLPMDGEKGWYLVTVDGYSIGWAKLAGGMLKNHYPKGLRK